MKTCKRWQDKVIRAIYLVLYSALFFNLIIWLVVIYRHFAKIRD